MFYFHHIQTRETAEFKPQIEQAIATHDINQVLLLKRDVDAAERRENHVLAGYAALARRSRH